MSSIVAISDGDPPLSNDAHCLDGTARAFSRSVGRDSDGTMPMSLLDWTVTAVFSADGALRYARETGPGSGNVELDMRSTSDVLEAYGSPAPPP
ncbi:hypothetical protein ACFV6D_37780 [Kitasatospora sp. NPDC059812]|uniref:hypothetical protein n=1 Tax=Kitasatospora sp. NPDC059812 TaxID=3346958 RepID=UPI0036699459